MQVRVEQRRQQVVRRVMAWKSPVKCRLILSTGSSDALPPPVAPPFMPNTGPSDGSRSAATALWPSLTSPCVRPMVLTVLPSPLVVGVMAVTRISLPRRVGKPLERLEADLGDVAAVGFEQVVGQTEAGSDVGNG